MQDIKDRLNSDIVDNIYQQLHKLINENIHKELHDCFEGVYKVNLYEMKYDEVYNKFGKNSSQVWIDNVIYEKQKEIYEEHCGAEKLSKILSVEHQEYLMKKYIFDDIYNLDGWWIYNKGYDSPESEYYETDGSENNEE